MEKNIMVAATTGSSNRPLSKAGYANEQSNLTVLEAELVLRAQRDDLEAFNQLVLNYQDAVYRQALWILAEPEAAEDAAQEAFLLAYCHIHTFRGGPFRPWLLKITTNYCLDQIRSARRRSTLPIERYDANGEEIEPYWIRDPGETPEQALEQSELADEILLSVQKLGWEYRIPVILADIQELDYEQASAVMKIPIGTYKSRLARARQKLRKELLKETFIRMKQCHGY